MEAPSDTPPSSLDEKSPNQVSQVIQQPNDDHQDSKVTAANQGSPTLVFVNSESIREEQIQNAVKFLSHPKVSGSPVIYRRSFLEKKGLTKEEIDEAFRRVPDSTPAVTAAQPSLTYQDGQLNPASNVSHQPSAQVLQATPVGPAGSISTMGIPSRFHWWHALLAVGYLAVSGAGTAMLFKNAIIPRLKSWIRKIVLEEEDGLPKKPSIAEENALAAKAAADAAADVARAIQEMLATKSEEKKCFEELISLFNVQVRELRSMSNTIQKLESGQSINARIGVEEREGQRISRTNSKVFLQPNTNGKGYTDPRSVRSLAPPANSRLAPRIKEIIPVQNSSTSSLPTKVINTSDAFGNNQLTEGDAVPWWKRRNVRMMENKAGDGSSNVSVNEWPAQRTWVPPLPPPVAMPEAAAAIRQRKKPFYQKEQMIDDQSLLTGGSSDLTDELQRITKISESGGVMEANDESPVINPTEIQ